MNIPYPYLFYSLSYKHKSFQIFTINGLLTKWCIIVRKKYHDYFKIHGEDDMFLEKLTYEQSMFIFKWGIYF